MKIGVLLTKNSDEPGFGTFTELLKLYIAGNDVSIYLLGNGVYCSRENLEGELEYIFKNSQVYAYKNDIEARGIPRNHLKKEVILFEDYEEMVKNIMENLDQVISI